MRSGCDQSRAECLTFLDHSSYNRFSDPYPNKAKVMQATRLFSVLLASFFFSGTASSQVFDSGPSDSALFTNVFNLPGDSLPDNGNGGGNIVEVSIGGVKGETTQVNVADGTGPVFEFEANEGSEVNFSGGLLPPFFVANDGTEVNISGGTLNFSFSARSGSLVNISGGSASGGHSIFIAGEGSVVNINGGESVASGGLSVASGGGGAQTDAFIAEAGSEVNLFGSDFALDGVLLENLDLGKNTIFDRNVTLSGLLEDGSPFSFDLNIGFVPLTPS